jgi:dTMP kinase
MSENQKRKLELKRQKKEAEEKARREEEERVKQEKLRQQREKEERETEARRLKTEALFRGLAAANQLKEEQKASATSFESIMQEQANLNQKMVEKEKKLQQQRAAQNSSMKFDYLDKESMPVLSGTVAATTEFVVA